jgi:hypothetical protein
MANYLKEITDDPEFAGSSALCEAYVECRSNGCSVSMAKMLALQSPPSDFKTDRTFMAGLQPLADDPKRLIRYRKQAERAGVDTAGAVYMRQLATRPGDPKALVRGIDDIRRLAKERKIRVETANEDVLVDSLGDQPAEMPDPGVDAKIIERETRTHERRVGKLKPQQRNDFKEKLFNRRKPAFSKAKFQAK